MANGEVVRIIMELLSKTKSSEVPWAEPSGIDMLRVMYPESVFLSLPKSKIIVRRSADKQNVEFQIENLVGAIVQKVTAAKNDGLYAPLTELLATALNQARKVEQTMRDVDEFLKKPPPKG